MRSELSVKRREDDREAVIVSDDEGQREKCEIDSVFELSSKRREDDRTMFENESLRFCE